MFDLYFKCHKSTTLYLKKQLLSLKKDFSRIFGYLHGKLFCGHPPHFGNTLYDVTDGHPAFIRLGQQALQRNLLQHR